ncbi:MAG: hypothetical protein OER86_11440 [Phycisphaerae bacterium]|nr:hypothetical protein [Phycisphaerae bacterium]
MGKKNLFDNTGIKDGSGEPAVASASLRERVSVAAHRLTIQFSEDVDVPARYRKLSNPSQKVRKIKADTDIEKRFRANVESWERLIKTMLDKLDRRQAWRFINLSPDITEGTNRIAEQKDFCDFMDYLFVRREKEKCNADELGGLARLSVAFQREIEKQVKA